MQLWNVSVVVPKLHTYSSGVLGVPCAYAPYPLEKSVCASWFLVSPRRSRETMDIFAAALAEPLPWLGKRAVVSRAVVAPRAQHLVVQLIASRPLGEGALSGRCYGAHGIALEWGCAELALLGSAIGHPTPRCMNAVALETAFALKLHMLLREPS